MPDDCNGSVEWVKWEMTRDPNYITTLKDPRNAPEPTKTIANRLKGLKEEAQADVARKSEPEKFCQDCKESAGVSTPTDFPDMTVWFRWPEDYEGEDESGATVTVHAKYSAMGSADFKKHKWSKECAPRWWGNVSYNFGDDELMLPAKVLVHLPEEELLNLLVEKGLREKFEEIIT